MSAPDTNIEKQTKRHKFSLMGMGGVVLVAGALFVGLLVWTFAQSDEPTKDAAVTVTIDGN